MPVVFDVLVLPLGLQDVALILFALTAADAAADTLIEFAATSAEVDSDATLQDEVDASNARRQVDQAYERRVNQP